MKRFMIGFMAAAFIMTAPVTADAATRTCPNGSNCQFVDKNKDGICDKQAANKKNCTNKNKKHTTCKNNSRNKCRR